ncbi:MAG TPA: DUF2877 domain-containing protein [Chloroflexia bacterium]|nr:DUF2877 domain-containing protein [Chloroflexia bacterium]
MPGLTAAKMLQIDAISFGPEAAALVAGGIGGRVLAVLRNAIYVEGDGGHIVAIVDEHAEDGPLTVRIHDLPALLRAVSPHPGAAVQVTGRAIEIHGLARVRWAGRLWVPHLPKRVGKRAAILTVCDALAQIIAIQEVEPVAQRLTVRLAEFHHATMEDCIPQAIEAITGLLGLGPGLTPSGDDMMAGLLASLAWQARLGIVSDKLVCSLVEAVREVAPSHTNRISARLLHYAGEGVLYAPAMELGEALLVGDTPALHDAARRLCTIGNTTGVDVATGLLTGIRLGTSLAQLYERD